MINKSIFKILLIPLFCFSASCCETAYVDKTPRRVYLCFTNTLRPKEDEGFAISMDLWSRDNKSASVECHELIKGNIALYESRNETVWYCDVPDFADISTMHLKYKNSLYSTIGPYYMDSILFNWSATGYHISNVDTSTEWTTSLFTPEQFSDFILSRTDPYSDSSFDGYKVYPLLLETFYKHFSKEEKEALNSIYWEDEYIGKMVSASEKWAELKQHYNSYSKKSSPKVTWLFYVFGSLILASVLFFLVVFIIPPIRRKFLTLISKKSSRVKK